jgi:hypothetical protein
VAVWLCDQGEWNAWRNMEPGGDEAPLLIVTGCVGFSDDGWTATLTEDTASRAGWPSVQSLVVLVRELGSGRDEPFNVPVRWERPTAEKVDWVEVRLSGTDVVVRKPVLEPQ